MPDSARSEGHGVLRGILGRRSRQVQHYGNGGSKSFTELTGFFVVVFFLLAFTAKVCNRGS